jgi:hypothetical protein
VVLVKDWHEVTDKANLAKWLQRHRQRTSRETVWDRLEPARVMGAVRAAFLVRSHEMPGPVSGALAPRVGDQ